MNQSVQGVDLPIQMFVRPKGRKPTGKPPKKSAVRPGHTSVGVYMSRRFREKLESLARADNRSLSNFIAWTLQACVENQSIDEHGVIVVRSPTPIK